MPPALLHDSYRLMRAHEASLWAVEFHVSSLPELVI